MYGIILLYNLINMGVIVENFKNGEENYLCAVNMGVYCSGRSIPFIFC